MSGHSYDMISNLTAQEWAQWGPGVVHTPGMTLMWCRDPLGRHTHPQGINFAVGRLQRNTSVVHTAAQYFRYISVALCIKYSSCYFHLYFISICIHIYIVYLDTIQIIDFYNDTDMFSFSFLDLIVYSLIGTLSLIPFWIIFLPVTGYQEHSESDTTVVGSSCG